MGNIRSTSFLSLFLDTARVMYAVHFLSTVFAASKVFFTAFLCLVKHRLPLPCTQEMKALRADHAFIAVVDVEEEVPAPAFFAKK